jgi:hypothetical protein
MIIDFTVENYRSIKNAVTLSAVAQSREKAASQRTRRSVRPDSEIAPTYSVEGRNLELLPVLGIFGANASGKTNVIRALDDLLQFMTMGAGESRGLRMLSKFVPFKLNKSTSVLPTRFELRVVHVNTIFTYTLLVNQARILKERLEYIPPPPHRKISRLLFERLWESESNKHVWKNGTEWGNTYIQIQESLQDHAPFMSFLTINLKVELLQEFTRWLRNRWPGLTLGYEDYDYWVATQILGDVRKERRKNVEKMVKAFDTGISKIKIEKVDSEGADGGAEFKVLVEHQTDGKPISWPLEDESTGTQRLFSLAYKTLDALHLGGLMLVDELGSNIHPLITKTIVRIFQRLDTNPNRGQLIFTSHDNTLQRGLLRRDQIWFTQKQKGGSTDLYPLSDFRPRNDLAVDKAYLDGRFGGVPIAPAEEELILLSGIE